MLVKPGTRLIYANGDEDGRGINIGEVGSGFDDDRYVNVPLKDIPQLIKRLKEVARELREPVVEDAAQE
jgi:hypothetical protein